MKTLPLALLLICGCADNHIAQPKLPLDESFYNPPNTTTITVGGETHTIPRAELEEQVYRASIQQIENAIINERRMISDGSISQDEACKIDTLIDSRGGRHPKPYCQ